MRAPKQRIDFVNEFLNRVFVDDLHAKRILSLANGTLGVMSGAALAVSLSARRSRRRGACRQVGDQTGRPAVEQRGCGPLGLVRSMGSRGRGTAARVVVAMDWTDFDADNQSTLALHLVTRHGRATPLLWLTVDKDELKNQRNDFEDLCLSRLKALLPDGVTVTILADRGFGDVKLFEFLQSLGFRYVIRFRGNIHVTAADGETRLAADWVGKAGRAHKLRDAEISAARHEVGAVVCVKAVGMKEAWHLAASDGSLFDRYGVRLSRSSAPRLLRQLGLSAQRPLWRAYQRSEAVQEGLTKTSLPFTGGPSARGRRYSSPMRLACVRIIPAADVGQARPNPNRFKCGRSLWRQFDLRRERPGASALHDHKRTRAARCLSSFSSASWSMRRGKSMSSPMAIRPIAPRLWSAS